MTKQEEKSINDLHKLLYEIKTENNSFREKLTTEVTELKSRVDKKHLPVNLEQQILETAQNAINTAIAQSLTGYQSPLIKLVTNVVDENSKELRQLISDSFTHVIRTDEFKNSIISAFSHKVAKTIISNNDGLFDKVSNELKQDSIFKAKMSLAVSNVVEECLNNK